MARRVFALLPLAAAAALVLTWPLPLRSWTVGAAAIVLAALTVETLRRAQREWPARRQAAALVGGAMVALATVAIVVLGYAAYAIAREGVFGPVTRLGYPFLVASGLRLEGGAWLALLCGIVGLVPIAFSDPSSPG